MITEEQVQKVVDALDVAAKEFPIKALAGEIFKGESTLRGELNGQPGHKLGLTTALLILARTQDLRALDRIEEVFGRVGIPLPSSTRTDPAPLMTAAGKLAREFGEHVTVLGCALMDGTVDRGEAAECLKELRDTVRAAMELQCHLEKLAGEEP